MEEERLLKRAYEPARLAMKYHPVYHGKIIFDMAGSIIQHVRGTADLLMRSGIIKPLPGHTLKSISRRPIKTIHVQQVSRRN